MSGTIGNTLVIAPHPDDEVLGCGGTIKKLTNLGINVVILIITKGKKDLYSEERIANVRMESLQAHKILGISETRFLDFPAPDLDLISVAELATAIAKVINEFKIDTVYLPHHGDIHQDHKAVFTAGLIAARPLQENQVRNLFAYETLSETEWAEPSSNAAFIPTKFVNIEDTFVFKLEAMKCYKSQLREFPNPRSLKSIEALANLRGSTVGCSHAEAFMTIRIIDN